MTMMVKRARDLASSTWKHWKGRQKTDETAVKHICPCCGAMVMPADAGRGYCDFSSVLGASASYRYPGSRGYGTMDGASEPSRSRHMMIWREPNGKLESMSTSDA